MSISSKVSSPHNYVILPNGIAPIPFCFYVPYSANWIRLKYLHSFRNNDVRINCWQFLVISCFLFDITPLFPPLADNSCISRASSMLSIYISGFLFFIPYDSLDELCTMAASVILNSNFIVIIKLFANRDAKQYFLHPFIFTESLLGTLLYCYSMEAPVTICSMHNATWRRNHENQ